MVNLVERLWIRIFLIRRFSDSTLQIFPFVYFVGKVGSVPSRDEHTLKYKEFHDTFAPDLSFVMVVFDVAVTVTLWLVTESQREFWTPGCDSRYQTMDRSSRKKASFRLLRHSQDSRSPFWTSNFTAR
jgi:hypothetical protein